MPLIFTLKCSQCGLSPGPAVPGASGMRAQPYRTSGFHKALFLPDGPPQVLHHPGEQRGLAQAGFQSYDQAVDAGRLIDVHELLCLDCGGVSDSMRLELKSGATVGCLSMLALWGWVGMLVVARLALSRERFDRNVLWLFVPLLVPVALWLREQVQKRAHARRQVERQAEFAARDAALRWKACPGCGGDRAVRLDGELGRVPCPACKGGVLTKVHVGIS